MTSPAIKAVVDALRYADATHISHDQTAKLVIHAFLSVTREPSMARQELLFSAANNNGLIAIEQFYDALVADNDQLRKELFFDIINNMDGTISGAN